MPVEEIIKEYEAQKAIIAEAQKKQDALIADIVNANQEAYDWISVKKASELVDVSQPVIYAKINRGQLKSKRIASKVFVLRSEIIAIDDKYGA